MSRSETFSAFPFIQAAGCNQMDYDYEWSTTTAAEVAAHSLPSGNSIGCLASDLELAFWMIVSDYESVGLARMEAHQM